MMRVTARRRIGHGPSLDRRMRRISSSFSAKTWSPPMAVSATDDTGFTADGTFIDGVLHHGGMILYRRE